MFTLGLCALTQNAIVSGANNAVLSTLERAFSLSAMESAIFLSLYDIASILASPIIGYFGDRRSKSKIIALSMFGLSIASLFMILPQFMSSSKNDDLIIIDSFWKKALCHVTNISSKSLNKKAPRNTLMKIKLLFYASNFINGISSVSLYTIAVSYIEAMFRKEQVAMRQGFYFAASAMGVGIGMLLTGNFLNISAHKNSHQNLLLLNAHSYDWIGAWWIIYSLSFTLNIVLSFLVLNFSPSLCTNNNNNQPNVAFNDFVKNALKIISSKIFCLITLCSIFETFLTKGLGSYLTKFFEYKYRLEASKATLIAGGIGFLSFVLGPLTGAYLVMRLKWNVKICAKFVCTLFFLTSGAFFGLIVTCSQEAYIRLDKIFGCNCDSNFFYPVCLGNKKMFQSPCHAGCLKFTKPNVFSNCLVFGNQTFDLIACSRPASQCVLNLILVSFICLVILFLSSIVFLPILRIFLESVDETNHSFALGIRSLMNKLFGNIPGPMLFAIFLDKSCIQWTQQENANKTCRLHENRKFSLTIALIAGMVRFLSAVSAFCCYFYLRKQDKFIVTNQENDHVN